MNGWISLHRKILENPILNRSRVYSNFEAWIWLLLKANHKDNKFMLGSELVKVKKGDMITSQKKLCKQFRWGNTKLRNFLKVLQKDGMIALESTTQATYISICNYESYQDSQISNKTQTKPKQHTHNTRTKTNNNVNKDNNVNNVNKIKVHTKRITYILNNKKYLEKYGKPLLQAFVDYWTEQSVNGIKMRYQKEKAFDIDRRLQTWAKNDYDGYYKKHKEDRINKEQDEYYRRNAEKVSAEETARQKQEIRNITNKMFKKI